MRIPTTLQQLFLRGRTHLIVTPEETQTIFMVKERLSLILRILGTGAEITGRNNFNLECQSKEIKWLGKGEKQ